MSRRLSDVRKEARAQVAENERTVAEAAATQREIADAIERSRTVRQELEAAIAYADRVGDTGVSLTRLHAVLDAVPDVPPTEDCENSPLCALPLGHRGQCQTDALTERVQSLRSAVVPPDPPAEREPCENFNPPTTCLDTCDPVEDWCRPCLIDVATRRLVAAADVRARALRPFEELFNGGPDTACHTTWRTDGTECASVPMADLRAAFDRAVSEREGDGK